MTRSDGSLDTYLIELLISNTLTAMGFGGWSSPHGITLSELPSWYEQSYSVRKQSEDGSWVTASDAEKPSWSELEQAFNEMQSVLSIDDNQMILGSTVIEYEMHNIPEGVNDFVIQGNRSYTYVIGNNLDNEITGNVGNNISIGDKNV